MKTFAECCISEAHICIAHTEQLKYSIPDTSSNNTVKTVAEWINLMFFFTCSLGCGFQWAELLCEQQWRTCMGSSGLSGYALSAHNAGIPLMAPCVPSVCLIILIYACVRVCVHSWTGGGFYSLAALMLLEIRMLTQSLIWLHRSQPLRWNHINTNNVRLQAL